MIFLNFFGFLTSEAQDNSYIDLTGEWKLTWNEGTHGTNIVENFYSSFPKDPSRYIDVPVPLELHLAFKKLGLAEDVNYGINSLKSRWISEQCYQYYRVFVVPANVKDQSAWLVFEQLDLNAIIFLNGEKIGEHSSAFRPCRINVSGKLKKGENILIVGIESGLYGISDKEGNTYNIQTSSILNKRHWQRKPQYQFGWDWNPQLINVGITGNVRLEWTNNVRFDQMVVWNKLSDKLDKVKLTIRSFIERTGNDSIAILRTEISETGQKVLKEVNLKKGLNLCITELSMNNPRLWWPIGQGEQSLYTVKTEIIIKNQVVKSFTRRSGIRKVEIDQSVHPVAGKYFTIKINNRPVFMKGGNWVPPDMIYSSITDDHIKQLVDLAVNANFNMLRIWGGGKWAGHRLLDICDERGILVWHDLLFACTKYPGNNVEFNKEIRKEVTWGAREFSSHPSIVVWCGNNEIEWATIDWSYENWGNIAPDYSLFHLYIPKILKEEDQNIIYWPSSPYSTDLESPNNPLTGDQHPWEVCLGKEGPDFWAYRNYVDRFPNEGGVLGASSPATLRQFLPYEEQFINSFSWQHHDNQSNYEKEEPGITYRMIDFWLGKDYSHMSLEHYAFASGLLQAEGFSEYINNFRRRMFSSSSAIFWMYNDSWPVTHGWTIVDYYLRKKMAYYPVKRALNPVSVIVVEENNNIVVYGINDTPSTWKGDLQYGIFSFAGQKPLNLKKTVTLNSDSSTPLASIPKEEWEKTGFNSSAAFAVLSRRGSIQAQHRLLITRFKENQFEKPEIKIERKADKVVFTSPTFVWAVSIDLNGEDTVSDNCFDLFPGIPYSISWPENKALPKVLFSGNELMRTKYTN
jgi:beta-mannosidase